MTGENKPLADKPLNERPDLNFALKAAGLGVWELDPATNRVTWDECGQKRVGLTVGDGLTYEPILRHIHPDDQQRVDKAVKWAMNVQSGGEYDITYCTIGADDGRLRWVRSMGRGYFNEQSHVVRFAGIARQALFPPFLLSLL